MDQLGQTAIRYPSFGVIKKGGVWMIWAHLWQRRLLKDDDFSVVDTDKLVSSSLYLVRCGNADTCWGEDRRWKLWDCGLTSDDAFRGNWLLTYPTMHRCKNNTERREEPLHQLFLVLSLSLSIGLSSFRLNRRQLPKILDSAVWEHFSSREH